MTEALYLTKHFALVDVKADGDGPDLVARAAAYGNVDRDGDVFAVGAFADARLPVPLLRSHDRNDPVGRITSLSSEEDGLYVEAAFSTGAAGSEARSLTRDGGFPFLSVGVRYYADDTEVRDGVTVIKRAELLEVSIVTVPANPRALVLTAKSHDGGVQVETAGDGIDATKLAGLIADELERRAAARAAHQDTKADPLDALRDAAAGLGEPYAAAITAHAEALLTGPATSGAAVGDEPPAPTVTDDEAQDALREVEDLLSQV